MLGINQHVILRTKQLSVRNIIKLASARIIFFFFATGQLLPRLQRQHQRLLLQQQQLQPRQQQQRLRMCFQHEIHF